MKNKSAIYFCAVPYHLLFWVVYLLVESFQVFTIGEWELRSMNHSLVYHASLLIPRTLIVYGFIYALLPYSLWVTRRMLPRVILYVVYLLLGLIVYRAFLNLVAWPLIMNHSPEFNVLDLRLSAYSLLKVITPLSMLLGIISVKREYETRIRNEQLEKEKYKAELKYLRAQINPHFLFNTLNSLYVLAMDKSDETPAAIAKLASLFRYVLENSVEEVVSIQRELDILQNYIDLEKLRHYDDLEISFQVNVPDKQRSIPPLLLLPFVENTFKHGAAEAIEAAFININIHQKGDKLVLVCENSFDPEATLLAEREGQGIKNVLQRLRLLYSDRFVYEQEIKEKCYRVKLQIELLV